VWGILNIRKPFDVTSRDVVNHVQRLVRPHRAGHAGTLDPLATGVLVVCVGAATRLIEFIQARPKRYIATFLLGRSSVTDDLEGPVCDVPGAPVLTRAECEAVLPQFCGQIQQRPPAYSALKIRGRRAYELARRGESVALAARPVVVHSLQIVRYDYPQLTLAIECGSGTYVRALGRDVAHALGTAAVMSALERTAIGSFVIEQACTLEQLDRESLANHLLPALRAVDHLPHVVLSAEQLARLQTGASVAGDAPGEDRYAAAVDACGDLAAVLRSPQVGRWHPDRNFLAR
jgi:tRNA pseudouridine55 synthase